MILQKSQINMKNAKKSNMSIDSISSPKASPRKKRDTEEDFDHADEV